MGIDTSTWGMVWLVSYPVKSLIGDFGHSLINLSTEGTTYGPSVFLLYILTSQRGKPLYKETH